MSFSGADQAGSRFVRSGFDLQTFPQYLEGRRYDTLLERFNFMLYGNVPLLYPIRIRETSTNNMHLNSPIKLGGQTGSPSKRIPVRSVPNIYEGAREIWIDGVLIGPFRLIWKEALTRIMNRQTEIIKESLYIPTKTEAGTQSTETVTGQKTMGNTGQGSNTITKKGLSIIKSPFVTALLRRATSSFYSYLVSGQDYYIRRLEFEQVAEGREIIRFQMVLEKARFANRGRFFLKYRLAPNVLTVVSSINGPNRELHAGDPSSAVRINVNEQVSRVLTPSSDIYQASIGQD